MGSNLWVAKDIPYPSIGEQILSRTGEIYERMFSYHQSARGYFHVPISENWREILWSDWLVKNILIYISSLPPENRHHLVLGFDKCLSAKICMNKVRWEEWMGKVRNGEQSVPTLVNSIRFSASQYPSIVKAYLFLLLDPQQKYISQFLLKFWPINYGHYCYMPLPRQGH